MFNVLLDKNVVRKVLEAFLRIAVGRTLSPQQRQSLAAFQRIVQEGQALITMETFHLFQIKALEAPYAVTFLRLVEVLGPTRYARRWARRLRQMELSREDAWLLALSSFGTPQAGGQTPLRVDFLLTFDRKLVGACADKTTVRRFESFVRQLDPPFSRVSFPAVLFPEDFLQQRG